MAVRNEWRIARICLWWGVLVACLVALIQGAGGLQPWSIVALALLGSMAASTAIFEHKWHHASLRAAILITTVWGVMGYGAYAVWPKPPTVVDVSPRNLIFTSTGDTYDIKVRNLSDADVYVVELLIRATNDIGSEDDFEVYVPDESLHELEGVPHQNPPAYDINGLSCKVGEPGNKLTYLFAIDHMGPHETRHVVVNYKGNKSVDLISKIINFDKAQTSISSSKGRSETRSIPIQDFGCNGMARVYMFRPKPQ